MKESQKISVRKSEVRSELAALAEQATLSKEDSESVDTLRGELATLEKRWRAAIAAEDTAPVAPETRELSALTQDASLGRALKSIAEMRALDGAEGELQSECGLSGNSIPWQLLERRAVSPAPTDVAETMDSSILGRVFPMSSLDFINAERIMVDAAERIFPVLTAGAEPASVAKDAVVDETAGAWETTVLSPKRLGASILIRREDTSVFPQLEASLRMDLSEAINAQMDKEIMAEVFKSSSPKIPAPTGATSVVNFATGLALATGGIDGERASMLTDVKLLVGSETYRKFAELERSTGAAVDLLEYLGMRTGGVKVSARIAAPDNANNRQECLRINGMYRSIVVPTWQGMQATVDSVSLANRGQIRIVLDCLYNYAILRGDDYTRLSVKVA